MSWLSDTEAEGKTMQHMDGEMGTVLQVVDDCAVIRWSDGAISTEHEDFLTYPAETEIKEGAE